jgi:hypothetical protein
MWNSRQWRLRMEVTAQFEVGNWRMSYGKRFAPKADHRLQISHAPVPPAAAQGAEVKDVLVGLVD